MFVWQSNRAESPIPVVIFFGRTENPVKKARNTNASGCFKLITKTEAMTHAFKPHLSNAALSTRNTITTTQWGW